jgi:hypothetical protein
MEPKIVRCCHCRVFLCYRVDFKEGDSLFFCSEACVNKESYEIRKSSLKLNTAIAELREKLDRT